MATELSDYIRYLTATKQVDYSADTFKIILMATGFVFNPATHQDYADVSASELATGNGYTAGGATLAGVAVTNNTTLHKTQVTWTNPTWTASGGSIGPSPGAIIYDDTITTPHADPIVGYIDFGGDQTQASGGVATIANVEVDL